MSSHSRLSLFTSCASTTSSTPIPPCAFQLSVSEFTIWVRSSLPWGTTGVAERQLSHPEGGQSKCLSSATNMGVHKVYLSHSLSLKVTVPDQLDPTSGWCSSTEKHLAAILENSFTSWTSYSCNSSSFSLNGRQLCLYVFKSETSAQNAH